MAPTAFPGRLEALAALKRLAGRPGTRWVECFAERRCVRRIGWSLEGGIRTLAADWDGGCAFRSVHGERQILHSSATGLCARSVLEAEGGLVEFHGSPSAATAREERTPREAAKTDRSGFGEESAGVALWIESQSSDLAQWIEALIRHLPDRRVAIEATLSLQGIFHASSDSPEIEDTRTGLLLRLVIPLESAGTLTRRWAARDTSGLVRQFDPHDAAARIEEACQRLGDTSPTPSGEFPVVFAAGSAGLLLHEAVGHFLEGDARRGSRLGADVPRVSSLLTVLDDPAALEGRGTYRVDDEGTAAGAALLVEKGRVVGTLGDRWNAPATTGHARRQTHRDAPLPRMAATCCGPGPHAPEEILSEVTRGIFVDEMRTGWADPSSGEFILHAAEGRLIEGGRLTAPTRDVVLVGRVPETLSLIDRMGSDVLGNGGAHSCVRGGQAIAAIVGAPTLRIAKMRVSGMNA